jgi:hypothetical protein
MIEHKKWGLIRDGDILIGKIFTCPHCNGQFSIQREEVKIDTKAKRLPCRAGRKTDCKMGEDGYCAECHSRYY